MQRWSLSKSSEPCWTRALGSYQTSLRQLPKSPDPPGGHTQSPTRLFNHNQLTALIASTQPHKSQETSLLGCKTHLIVHHQSSTTIQNPWGGCVTMHCIKDSTVLTLLIGHLLHIHTKLWQLLVAGQGSPDCSQRRHVITMMTRTQSLNK